MCSVTEADKSCNVDKQESMLSLKLYDHASKNFVESVMIDHFTPS